MITVPDFINGLFELGGGLAIFLNVKQILIDKSVKGVHWVPTLFFTSWGYWNCFYYPHLGQWVSFTGGLLIVSMNTVWVALMIKYWRKP